MLKLPRPMSRLASLLAVSAALLTAGSLAACKDDGTTTPAPAGAGPAPVASPDSPPAGGDAPAAGTPAPADPATSAVTCTPETRKGGMCTREYQPVCGTLADDTSKTFPNKCVACSDEKVSRYVEGPCPGEPPA